MTNPWWIKSDYTHPDDESPWLAIILGVIGGLFVISIPLLCGK